MKAVTQYVETVPLGPGRPSVRVAGSVEDGAALLTVSYSWGDGAWHRVDDSQPVRLPLAVLPEFLETVRRIAAELAP